MLTAMVADTVGHANEVLATFRGDRLTFERTANGRLWIASRHGRKVYQLRASDGSWPTFRYGGLGMGGTEAMATAQLVRWVRGLTRRPLRCWEYWCSDTVGLGGPDTITALTRYGYADPVKTACVLCGEADATDWWSRNGVVGPCCRFGVCRENRKAGG